MKLFKTYFGASLLLLVGTFMVTANQVMAAPVRGVSGDKWADIILGKPSFNEITPYTTTSNDMFINHGVFIDRGNGGFDKMYVYDSGHSRILGFDLATCMALGGDPKKCVPEIVLGQPDFTSAACNGDGGFQNWPYEATPSASTLCGVTDGQLSVGEAGEGASMAVDASHNLYVADPVNNRVLKYTNPFTTDQVADEVWGQTDFTGRGCNKGDTNNPTNSSLCFSWGNTNNWTTGVDIDSHHNLWVVDSGNNRVLRFSDSGGTISKTADLVLGQGDFSSKGSGSGLNQLADPNVVRVTTGDDVYVSDHANNRILKYTDRSIGAAGEVFGSGFDGPTGIDFDPTEANRVWITNTGVSAVELWDLNSKTLIRAIGSDHDGNFLGQATGGVGVDTNGNVFVASWLGFSRYSVLEFDKPAGNVNAYSNRLFQPGVGGHYDEYGIGWGGGVVVSNGQVIVADNGRLLYWNTPNGITDLTNGKPADGVVAAPDFNTLTYNCCTLLKADKANHLYTTTGINGDDRAHVAVYDLPLTNGASPTHTIYMPLDVLGGGQIDQQNPFEGLSGIAPATDSAYLWVSHYQSNRVVRIRNPLTTPVVDVILGQTDLVGHDANQGGSETDTTLFNPGQISFDNLGNMYLADDYLEAAGNNRLLMYAAGTFPVDNPSVIFATAPTKIFPNIATWEPAFDSLNHMVVGFNPYHNNNAAANPNGGWFSGEFINPTGPSVIPDAHFNDYMSMGFGGTFDASDNYYTTDLDRSRLLIYKHPLSDALVPEVTEVTPVSSPTTDPTPSYTFNTTIEGDITYGGSCSSFTTYAATGDNTINFKSLDSGTYSDCTITVTSPDAVTSNTLTVSTFEVQGLANTTPCYDSQFGGSGSGDGKFSWAETVAVDSGDNIYAVDQNNNRIEKFDAVGSYIGQWGSLGSGNGEFNSPNGLAVDSANNVYVTDVNNNRIQKFDSDGNFIRKWGSNGTGDGQFDGPLDLYTDSSNNVYVTDSNNSRVQKFDSDGNFITKWGTSGSGNGQFSTPYGIAVSSAGVVYVADRNNNRVQEFDSSGTYLGQWGSFGSGTGQFNHPEGITVDHSDNVYVTEQAGKRVQRFTHAGVYVYTLGSAGSGDGQFNFPDGVVVNNNGDVYVADSGNNRIQRFTTYACGDHTAPVLAEVTPVSNPTDDTTPSYTFSSTEAGTATYGGACTSSDTVIVSGNNTITFSTLAPDTYSNCTITVTDASSNASSALHVSNFEVTSSDLTPPVLTEVTSVNASRNYVFNSTEPGTITYGGSCTNTGLSSTAIKIYKNGLRVDDIANIGGAFSGPSVASVPLQIASQNSGSNGFDGQIDEVKVYGYGKSDQSVASDLGDKLVGYWKMDEGGWTNDCSTPTVFDSSGNLLDGKWCATSNITTGKFGGAGSYDGDDEIKIDDTDLPVGSSARSISAWIYADTVSENNTIFFEGGHSASDGFYAMKINNNVCIGQWGGGDTCGATSLLDGGWYHVLLTYDGSRAYLYLNGSLEAAVSKIYSTTHTGNFYIGSYGSGTEQWKGRIDEVRFYDRYLDSTDALNLYNTIPNELVGHWRFDESTWTNDCSTGSVIDYSGNNNPGRSCPNGTGPTTSVAGKFGRAVHFNGVDDSIRVTTVPINDLTYSTVTVSAWVKWEGTGNHNYIVDKYSNKFSVSLDGQDSNVGIPRFYANGFGGVVDADNPITANVWHLITGTYDGTFANLYVDGTLVKSQSTGSNFTDNSGDWIIGCYQNCDPNYAFNGAIDDVRLYRRALGPSEVADLYAPPAPTSIYPINYWKFNEAMGTQTLDEGSNAQNGTLNLSPVWANNSYSCISGRCLLFDGTSYVSTVNHAGPTTGVTYDLWVKPNSVLADHVLLSQSSSSSSYMQLMSSGQDLSFKVFSGANTDYIGKTATGSLVGNVWQHIVAIWDAGKTASTGNNTITFDPLNDGTYADCTVTVTDSSGNVSNPLHVTSFTVGTVGESDNGSSSGSSSNSSSGGIDQCSVLSSVATPSFIVSNRISPTSVYLNWGPYSGVETFNIKYGFENGQWLYSTNVTGFSTTISDLPVGRAIWFEIAAYNSCGVGKYSTPRLVVSTAITPEINQSVDEIMPSPTPANIPTRVNTVSPVTFPQSSQSRNIGAFFATLAVSPLSRSLSLTAAVAPLILTLFSLLPYLNFLQIIGLLMGILSRRRKAWGKVIDQVSNKPINRAILSLYGPTGNLMAQAISDSQGRYAFSVKPGDYKLVAKKPGYRDQTLAIQSTGDIYLTPVDPENEIPTSFSDVLLWISYILFALGFGYTLIIALFSLQPLNILNWWILMIYILVVGSHFI